MRILFVIPPYFDTADFLQDNKNGVLPAFTIPYGILSLEAYLKAKCGENVKVSIMDLNLPLRDLIETGGASEAACLETFNRLVFERMREFRPSIVGLSALFNSSYRYLEYLAKVIKAADQDTIVVSGGGLPSAAFKEILQTCPSIDAICKGEGEIPLVQLVNAENKMALLQQHPSWITREGILAGKVPTHMFVDDLDDISVLNYGIVNLDDYNSRSIDKRYIGIKKREMAIHTSRGCYFSCVFCSNSSIHGKKVRSMSVRRVIEEVRRMKEQFGLTVLLIEDDHFFFDKKRAKVILANLAQYDIRIEFPNGIAVYAIDDEVGSLLKKAGVSTVALAVESGSDYVLSKIIKKPLKVTMVKEKVEILRKYGILAHVFIVIGLPGEFAQHRQETIDLLINVGFDWAHIYCATPIVGSRLYDICIEKGYLANANMSDHVVTKAAIRAPGVDPEEISEIAYEMNLKVNFVNNWNFRAGNYDTALSYFSNVISKYPNHAFGDYYLAEVYEAMGGHPDLVKKHRSHFNEVIKKDSFWRKYAEKFNLITGVN